jgi:outer membrane lipoprotein-sorting protein
MEAATVAVADEALTTPEIFKKSQEAYAALTSYSDEGRIVTVTSGVALTSVFMIKLARPSLYRIQWEQLMASGYANKGVVWSAGDGDFFTMDGSAARKEASRENALGGATGVSGGAAATIPGTFFKMNWGDQLGGPLADEKRQANGKADDADCYVFTSELKGTAKTLWIGKKDFLIHQVRTVTSAAAMKAVLDQAAKTTGVHPQAEPHEITSTETHTDIVVNKEFLPADFGK